MAVSMLTMSLEIVTMIIRTGGVSIALTRWDLLANYHVSMEQRHHHFLIIVHVNLAMMIQGVRNFVVVMVAVEVMVPVSVNLGTKEISAGNWTVQVLSCHCL